MIFDSPVEIILFVIEIIGVISFATSGAITAIRRRADYLGIIILTLIEIFGGGLLRDMILISKIDNSIPHIFWDKEYFILAIVGICIATFWFFIAYFKKSAVLIEKHRHDAWIYLLDALGLAVFCIYGSRMAFKLTKDLVEFDDFILVVCMGVITGTCGGMFRDVFVGEIPMVFRKHFYMTPCIIGCITYTTMVRLNCNELLSMIIGILLIVSLRVFATIFKWNLPTCKGYDQIIDEINLKGTNQNEQINRTTKGK